MTCRVELARIRELGAIATSREACSSAAFDYSLCVFMLCAAFCHAASYKLDSPPSLPQTLQQYLLSVVFFGRLVRCAERIFCVADSSCVYRLFIINGVYSCSSDFHVMFIVCLHGSGNLCRRNRILGVLSVCLDA